MNPERWRTVTALFDKAMGLPDIHRDAFLVSACGADTELLAEVRSLLDVHTDDPTYLEANAWVQHGGVIEEAIESQNVEERVGNYRLLRKIGSGGMGSVYLAERDDDEFRKQVAIKFIRGGAIRENAIKRFRRERQILARLEHPGIARLLDGGTTSRGTPYFVMEFVEGKLLLDYCDELGMGIRSRVELFLKVCEAVDYAHQRLIVHRDLKASNILVDAEGQPKLLDFGIAKVLQPDEDGQMTLTQTGMRQFTPDYASPEQIRGDQVTTATDVYSLGVLLYEMLTGRRPFHFQSTSPVDILTILLERQPPRPSAVVGKTEEISGKLIRPEILIWHRRTDLRTLIRNLSGDLDNIVLKALAKQPMERYGTAAAMARDLRAYLDGHMVSAQKATAGYRLSKFLSRNAGKVAAGAAAFIVLLAALLVSTWQWRVAQVERARAETSSRQSREMARSLLFELHDALVNVPGATAARELLLHRTTSFLDDLSGGAGGDPEMQLELAEAYRKLAVVQGDMRAENLGQRSAALASYRKARSLAEAASANAKFRQRGGAMFLDLLADEMVILSDIGDREELKSTVELLAAAIAGEEKNASPELRLSRARAKTLLAARYVEAGRNDDARQMYRESREAFERLYAEGLTPKGLQEHYATSLKRSGAFSISEKRLPEAQEAYEKALQIERELLAESPDSLSAKFAISYTLSDLGYIQKENGKLDAAMKFYREALAIREAALLADPNSDRAKWGVASTLNYLGRIYAELGWFEQSREAYQRSVAIREELLAATPDSRSIELSLAESRANFAEALLEEASHSQNPRERTIALQRARNLLRQSLPVFEEREGRNELIGAHKGRPQELRNLLSKISSL